MEWRGSEAWRHRGDPYVHDPLAASIVEEIGRTGPSRLSQLARRLQTTPQRIDHHARRLERDGQLGRLRVRGGLWLVPSTPAPAAAWTCHFLLRDEAPARIVEALRSGPFGSQRELSDLTGIHPRILRNDLRRLVDIGVVEIERDGSRSKLRLNRDRLEELQGVLRPAEAASHESGAVSRAHESV